MSKVYGLIFDVDGVIADTEAVNARASIEMFEELLGVTGIRCEDFTAGLGRGAAKYVRAAAKVHGMELTDEQVEKATQMRQDKFLAILTDEPLPAFGGVLELMEEAGNTSDLRVAIATSSTRTKSEAVLRSAKIPYERMAYITGSDVQNKKPHPELFLTAAAKMGCEPADCVVIEDAPDGVAAAKAAGCKCIAVTNSTTPDMLAEADIIAQSLTEVNIQQVIKLIDFGGVGK